MTTSQRFDNNLKIIYIHINLSFGITSRYHNDTRLFDSVLLWVSSYIFQYYLYQKHAEFKTKSLMITVPAHTAQNCHYQ